jgi:hypothetical protein
MMKWTKRRPTKPGWYWVRRDERDHSPELVEIYERDGILCVAWLKRHYEEVVNVAGEWAGPVDPRNPKDSLT